MKFEVKSGNITITDPCYNRSTWCMIQKIAAKNGTWESEVDFENHEGRVARLKAWHSDHSGASYVDKIGDIGVDSGQAGIFDEDSYPRTNETGELGSLDNKDRKPISFYDECCLLTCGEDQWGSVKKYGSGVVSSSGYGDGGYRVYGEVIDGEVVAVEIEYISDEDEE